MSPRGGEDLVVWRAPQRRWARAMAAVWAAQAVVNGLQFGRRGLALTFAVLALACLVWALRLRRVRVTSDLQELRVSDRENVVPPWSQVREVRGDAGRRSTRAWWRCRTAVWCRCRRGWT